MTSTKAIGVAITGVLGGAFHLATGIFDPSFLVDAGMWYPVLKVFYRDLGPRIVPMIPWEQIGLVATLVFLAVHLHRIDKEAENEGN